MPVESARTESASRPIANSSDVLQSPEAFESLLGYSSSATRRSEVSVIMERRSGTSELEQASHALVRAIQYLTYEQRAGKVTSVRANRKAITILCGCVEQIAHVERREPAKLSLLSWLGSLRVN